MIMNHRDTKTQAKTRVRPFSRSVSTRSSTGPVSREGSDPRFLLCLCVSVVLAFRRVITFFVAHLQFVRLAIVVHVEIGNFDAQLVKLSIRLPDFWNESETVLIPQVGTYHLVDAGILALKPWKPRRPAGCLGEGSHDIVGLQECNLIQVR
jgi:hypothetical protein